MPEEGIVSPLPSQRALGDLVTDVLREMITVGKFQPGQHLRESQLADALRVSRGPSGKPLRVWRWKATSNCVAIGARS